MIKGLTQALIAVAVVTLAARVMANAPMIGNIPDIVVSNNASTTTLNLFAYPNAINLSAYVTELMPDGVTFKDPTTIMWSYEFVGTPKYRINNVDQLSGADNPANPPTAKLIAGPGTVNNDPAGSPTDSKITVRNIDLSPIGGPNTSPGATPGIVASETQAVTLFAGDGTTFAMKSIFLYTDNNGKDRLSPAAGTNVYTETFTNTVHNWAFEADSGTVTSSYDSVAGALCITVAALNTDNIGRWTGPYGILPLVQNAVYRIRAGVNSSQATQGMVPFWDMIVNNYGYDTPQTPATATLKGLNLYGANYMFLDNTGGANAAIASRNTLEFTQYWCPSPITTTQWNDPTDTGKPGPFAPSNAGNKDAFIEFRILDAASNLGTNGKVANGTLCLTDLTIDRFDISQVQVLSHVTLPSDTGMTQGGIDNVNSGGGHTRVLTYGTFSAAFAGGKVTVTPTNTSVALCEVQPGDFSPFDYNNAASVINDYPVAMTPNTLYRIQLSLSAPTAADANAPMDLFWLGADTPTNELINLSYVTLNAWHHAMPTTTPQSYTAFFYSNSGTAASNPAQFSQFRWRWMGGSNAALGGGGEPNTGGISIGSANVDKVTF